MNTTQLKNYAPKARKDFIEAVKARAAKFGISESEQVEMVVRDDVAMIYGEAYPREVYLQREKILELIREKGFESAMEAMAYTWFNRLMALRYMELHGFLDHGYRVLSHPEGASSPEILQQARHVELPGLDQARITELILAGDRDEELYRTLLLAQCHALHLAMPFLFEAINDATELLLPDNLLHSDSLIRKMVNEVPEEDWETVEVIGWLYQFYISEKKDQVIGKVVASVDIPAATQLFTPNWIVKYMVQNSLGAQWLATYPDSPIKDQMEYYIEPAEQTDEVKAQLAAITPSQLNPEEITLIDPASGSGHILVEAYDLFKAIYLERGYRQRDVAQLILEKNLFGLDIDERAAQLTGFALMMKGRADDRQLFERGVKLNVMVIQDSAGFDADVLASFLRHSRESGNLDYGLKPGDLTELKRLFEHATTFGSLIQVPEGLAVKLSALQQLSEATSQDLFVSEALNRLGPLVQQAEMLAALYDAVVANPPYMGGRSHTPPLKKFLKDQYSGYERDLFSAFIVRMISLGKVNSYVGVMTSFVWMFISTYAKLRSTIISTCKIESLIQLHYDAFAEAKAHVCTFVLRRDQMKDYRSSFVRLAEIPGADLQGPKTLEAIRNHDCGWFYEAAQDTFNAVPGSPIAYWVSGRVRELFLTYQPFDEVGKPRVGMQTANNDYFLRMWFELDWSALNMCDPSHQNWVAYCKGGSFRRWYGNNWRVLRYMGDGAQLRMQKNATLPDPSIFEAARCTWSDLTSIAQFAVRRAPQRSFYDIKGHSFFQEEECDGLLALTNSTAFGQFLRLINPTLSCQVGDVKRVPTPSREVIQSASAYEAQCVVPAKEDWDAYERSWDFQFLPILTTSSDPTPTLETSYTVWITQNRDTIAEMKRLEEENNRLFIDAYGLADELTPNVPIEQITLTVNPAYRYPNKGKSKLTEEEQWTRFRQDTMEELVSYAIGCMMGRYSLDEPGLIYAHSNNKNFDPNCYSTFLADDDGIVPLTDTEWFDDDAVNRFVEFIAVAWDPEHLEENLAFLVENLKPRANESSRDTIRRYLCGSFFKSHLKTYKKRPIYWLFSSGKQRALQCLVYLHRYNEGTLARMRMDYVVPLLGRLSARIESLSQDIDSASTAAQANKLRKQSEKYKKQLEELRTYDEKLRHYADQRITLDLDDGVKVNYGKFGDLLAEVKTVAGLKPKA